MPKNVTFHLGPTTGLASRQLTITRFRRAGEDVAPAAEIDLAAGVVEGTTVELPDNTIWQAILVDTRTSGEVSQNQTINFQTTDLQFPGPKNQRGDSSQFSILSMEDLSSSSSSSSVSSSSSSSVSSSSSSSVSSSSSSSVSSSSSSSVSSSSSSSSTSSSSASSLSVSSSSSSSSSSHSSSSASSESLT